MGEGWDFLFGVFVVEGFICELFVLGFFLRQKQQAKLFLKVWSS